MKLSKAYEPNQYEDKIYQLWEERQAFVPKNRGSKDSFSLVMPPPNANANIHMGTAITLDLEDIAVRYHRMKGEATLFLPGADHAGFETQAVYEKHLAKAGKSRFDFTREELYQQIWDFVAENKSNYETQFRKLGTSADWSRYTFTLDKKIVDRAYKTFKKMWDEDLIYRGERLVNYCTFHRTGFADIEVAHQEDKGHLWHIRYPLTDGSGEVAVATTRPETMLGDTAVAVHPDDKRYAKFVGKTIKLPLTNREIPILADDMVAQDFGTGAVKITPAHDQNDYEVAKRHDLPFITVIDEEGKMTDVHEVYRGLTVIEARKQVVADLGKSEDLIKTEDITHQVGHCYKCGTVIEPMLMEQWFIDMQSLAKPAIAALEANKITFYPDAKRIQLINYIKGLRDWNISRQIAWGIPIPAFRNIDDPNDWIFDERVDQEFIEIKGKKYHRDPDVLDTWFSSSSWPYATLDYPDGDDFSQFYPLSLMETGGEILQPWVSRMIMLGLYVTNDVPFKEVYIHGYVMAADGSKMSKSVGNVIDPIPVIEQYGSDALRMGLIAGRTAAVNRGYDIAKIEGARNFCNKLWNVGRFIEDKLGDDIHAHKDPSPQTPADHWMLSKLQHSAKNISVYLDQYRFAEAYDDIYHLLWDDFADWYIEASKAQVNPSILAFGLETILKLAHPFAPFVTETIWQTLLAEEGSLLTTSQWPTGLPKADGKAVKEFENIKTVVTEVRALAQALQTQDLTLHIPDMANHAPLITKLAKVHFATSDGEGEEVIQLIQTTFKAWVDVDPTTLKKFVASLVEQKTAQTNVIKQLESRLGNKAYVANAPEAIVTQTKEQLADAERQLASIKEQQKRFN